MVRSAVPLSADASAQIAERVLAHPDLPQRDSGHRLAAIRVSAENATAADATASSVVTVVLFDHTALVNPPAAGVLPPGTYLWFVAIDADTNSR